MAVNKEVLFTTVIVRFSASVVSFCRFFQVTVLLWGLYVCAFCPVTSPYVPPPAASGNVNNVRVLVLLQIAHNIYIRTEIHHTYTRV